MFFDSVVEESIQLRLNARPKRIAFIVDMDLATDDWINAIILLCNQIWGGRFHPIIPLRNNKIAPAWYKLLVAVDPDEIHVLGELTEELTSQIGMEIQPYTVIEHDEDSLTYAFTAITRSSVKSVGVEDFVAHITASMKDFAHPWFVLQDVDMILSESPTDLSFILRNFGALPKQLSDYLFRRTPMAERSIYDKETIAESFANRKLESGLILPVELSMAFAPRPCIHDGVFENRFQIVIGNSPSDAIYSWNRGLLPQAPGFNSIWLSEDLATPKMLKSVSRFIDIFWNPFGVTGPVQIVSTSCSTAKLNAVAQLLKEQANRNTTIHRLKRDFFPGNFKSAESSYSFEPSQYINVPLSDKNYIQNGHFRSPKPAYSSLDVQGADHWMLDITCFPAVNTLFASFDGAKGEWKLPRRLGMSQIFFPSSNSRITANSKLSLEVNTKNSDILIFIPPLKNLFTLLLQKYVVVMTPDFAYRKDFGRFQACHQSSNGSYLRGLVQSFKGLNYGRHFFADEFWRYIFKKFSGGFSEIKEDVQQLVERDLRIGRKITAQLIEDVSASFSTFVKQESEGSQSLQEESFAAALNQLQASLSSDDKKENLSIMWNDLTHLLNQNLMYQGSDVLCSNCGTRSWYKIDALTSNMRCNACLSELVLPKIDKLTFALSPIIRNGIKRHGLLNVLETLLLLYDQSSSSFLYLPSMNVFEERHFNVDSQAFTDLDVVALIGTKYVFGEVKSGPKGVLTTKVDKISSICQELKPDFYLIAAPSSTFEHENVMQHIENIKTAVEAAGVVFSLLKLNWQDEDLANKRKIENFGKLKGKKGS